MCVSLHKGHNSGAVGCLTWNLLFCVFIRLWHFGANHDGQIFSSCFQFYMSHRPTAGTIFSRFLCIFGILLLDRREISGSQGGGGVCRLVLRGGGLGNCPEIAHCHCPPSSSPLQLPLLASTFTFGLKAKFWPLIFYRKILTRSYRVSWHGGIQLWVESSMKCPYFMLQALFDGGD